MKTILILCFIVLETSFGDAKALDLDSFSHSGVPEKTIHGTVTPVRTTEGVPTRIRHIPRETDQSSAKATVVPAMTPSLPIKRKNSTKSDSLGATHKRNSTGPVLEPSTGNPVIRHIPRSKRDTLGEVTMPFSFRTLHMPCEFDISFWNPVYMTAQCQWIFNLRFQTENFFRTYMLYKMEGFFFGQYAIRIRRYELDPHAFNVD